MISILFSGVVPKPTGQVAPPGEAGGELHQTPGHLLTPFFALLWPPLQQLLGLGSAAGPLALLPHHHLHLAADPPGLHGWLAGPGNVHPISPSLHALSFAGLLPQLHGPGTQLPPVPHVPPAPGVPVLSWPQELQYCLAEDEGQGTYSDNGEDMVMIRRWTEDPQNVKKTNISKKEDIQDWICLHHKRVIF